MSTPEEELRRGFRGGNRGRPNVKTRTGANQTRDGFRQATGRFSRFAGKTAQQGVEFGKEGFQKGKEGVETLRKRFARNKVGPVEPIGTAAKRRLGGFLKSGARNVVRGGVTTALLGPAGEAIGAAAGSIDERIRKENITDPSFANVASLAGTGLKEGFKAFTGEAIKQLPGLDDPTAPATGLDRVFGTGGADSTPGGGGGGGQPVGGLGGPAATPTPAPIPTPEPGLRFVDVDGERTLTNLALTPEGTLESTPQQVAGLRGQPQPQVGGSAVGGPPRESRRANILSSLLAKSATAGIGLRGDTAGGQLLGLTNEERQDATNALAKDTSISGLKGRQQRTREQELQLKASKQAFDQNVTTLGLLKDKGESLKAEDKALAELLSRDSETGEIDPQKFILNTALAVMRREGVESALSGPEGRVVRTNLVNSLNKSSNSERGIFDFLGSFAGGSGKRATDTKTGFSFEGLTIGEGPFVTFGGVGGSNQVINFPDGNYVYLDNLSTLVRELVVPTIGFDNRNAKAREQTKPTGVNLETGAPD